MSIAIAKTWANAEVLTHTDLNAQVSDMCTNILPAATQSEVDTGTSSTVALVPSHNKISLASEATTTSGTTVVWSSIPSGVRRINIMFALLSTSGTSNIIVQIGDGGGIETTGYTGSATTIASATPSTANFTTGFGVTNAISAASILSGTITLSLEDASDFTWTATGLLASSNATTIHLSAGSKALSAELTQVQITTVGGSETFDGGVANISYER